MNRWELSVAKFNQGVEEKRNGNINKAIQLYEESFQLDPSDPEPYRAIGKAYHIIGNYDESVLAYVRYIHYVAIKWIREGSIRNGSFEELKYGWTSPGFLENLVRHLGASIAGNFNEKYPSELDNALKEDLINYRLSINGKRHNRISDNFSNLCIKLGLDYISKFNWPYGNWSTNQWYI